MRHINEFIDSFLVMVPLSSDKCDKYHKVFSEVNCYLHLYINSENFLNIKKSNRFFIKEEIYHINIDMNSKVVGNKLDKLLLVNDRVKGYDNKVDISFSSEENCMVFLTDALKKLLN